MKIKTRTELFGEKLGNTLAGNFRNKKTAPKTSEKHFASNLYKIKDAETRNNEIMKYVQEISKHSQPEDDKYLTCKRLIKRLEKKLRIRENSSHKLIEMANKTIALFDKKLKHKQESSQKVTESTIFGKYPEADCFLSDLRHYTQNINLLEDLFIECRTDAQKRDPELIRKNLEGKAQNQTNHLTYAFVENRISDLNASKVKIDNMVNFILCANPRDKDEITNHLYHTLISSDCSLWFTLNECRDRPKFWTTEHLTDLTLPENWKITNVGEEIVAGNPKGELNPRLVKSTLIASNGEINKKITHYHYENWFDHCPAPCEEILLECAKIASQYLQETGKPVGINCKGGVGRTGVLANIIYGIQHIDQELSNGKRFDDISINLVELNYNLRKQRRGLVSYPPQFIQVCEVVADYAEGL